MSKGSKMHPLWAIGKNSDYSKVEMELIHQNQLIEKRTKIYCVA